MAFQGSLAELHLPDIIQLVSVSGKTGVFHLSDGGHRGDIWLQEGRIVHAAHEDVQQALGIERIATSLPTSSALPAEAAANEFGPTLLLLTLLLVVGESALARFVAVRRN